MNARRLMNGLFGVIALLAAHTLAAQDPLFDGQTADMWLTNPDTGQLSGYDTGQWMERVNKNDYPQLQLGADDVLLINELSNSSLPMTPGQPAISLQGIGDAATPIGSATAGYDTLSISPDKGTFDGTVAINLRVSRAAVSSDDASLTWTVTNGAATPVVYNTGRIIIPEGAGADVGYFTHTIYLVSSGINQVDVTLRGTAVGNVNASATFTLIVDPADRRRDTDGDGIPDAVELDMGLNPLEDDWTADLDGDGWSEFDEWLRRFCLDPGTRSVLDGDTGCLDPDGLPLDSDNDDWSDFDEILRGTNYLDKEPAIVAATYPTSANAVADINVARFCTDGSEFYFNVEFDAAADDAGFNPVILRIGADAPPLLTGARQRIAVNFGETGEPVSVLPQVQTLPAGAVLPPNRWQEGPIANFNILSTGIARWQVSGSIPVGTQPFVAGDMINQVVVRSGVSGTFNSASYPISADIAACAGGAGESDVQQALRFKDFPAAGRLYEVEHIIDEVAAVLAIPGPANIQRGLQSFGGSQSDYSGVIVQSFTAVENNIAGVDVYVQPLADVPADDIILNIWNGSLRDGELLLSRTLERVVTDPDNPLEVRFRFEPVELQPGQVYFLEFRQDALKLQNTPGDFFAGGAIVEANGVVPAENRDLVFALHHDTAFVDGIGGTRVGMQWWNIGAAKLDGVTAYDPRVLLFDDEINTAGLTQQDIAPRRRMATLETALDQNRLPEMRLPAGQSVILSALQRHTDTPPSSWQTPLEYSRTYKTWLPRQSDVTPVAMLAENGAGAWETPAEWRSEFVSYLIPRLTLPVSPVLDDNSTLSVSFIESALSEEARLDGSDQLQLLSKLSQPGQPVYQSDGAGTVSSLAQPDTQEGEAQYAKGWEDRLQTLTANNFSLDDSFADAGLALSDGQPLADLRTWLRKRFYAGVPGSQSDEMLVQQLRRSFDGSCFVRLENVAELQALTASWNEFLDRCPLWYSEAELSSLLSEEIERHYQARLNVLPGAGLEIAADATLLDRSIDSDLDGYTNASEISIPIGELTLPWVTDSDGDMQADGDDPCPKDPYNECSSMPILPTITGDIDFAVLEPETPTGFALVSVQLERLYDEAVTVYYEATMGAGDTATPGQDFEAVSGSVTIAPGQLSALIEVPIIADGIDEGPEWFRVLLTGADNAVIADDGLVIVTLNDTMTSIGVPNVMLANTAITVDEHVQVILDASASTDPNNEPLTFMWRQVGGSPMAELGMTNTATAVFESPETGQPPATGSPVDLEFEVTVSNQSAFSATGRVTVTVNPVNDSPYIINPTPSVQVIQGNSWEWTHAALLNYARDPENDVLSLGALTQPSIGSVADSGTVVTYSSAGGGGGATNVQLSDPEVVAWLEFANGTHVLVYETGTASDFPGTERIVDINASTGARSLVYAGAPNTWGTTPGADMIWFDTATDMYRYDPAATPALISAPKPDPYPMGVGAGISGAVVDPRTGDLHFCERDSNGDWGWYRVDYDDLSVSPRYDGRCDGGWNGGNLTGFVIDNRLCISNNWDELLCTAQGGDTLDHSEGIFDFMTQPFPGPNESYRLLGVKPVGNAALLFIVKEFFSSSVDFVVRLIPSGFQLPSELPEPEPPMPGDPPPAEPDYPFPLLLEQIGKAVFEMPEVEVMPDGSAVMIVDHFQSTGPGGVGELQMWRWSGDSTDTTLSQLNIGVQTTEPNYFYGHMGDLQLIGNQLYWQVQDFDPGNQRVIYQVDPTPGLPSALTEFARVPGVYYNPSGAPSLYAPYDLWAASPDTFGYFRQNNNLCDLMQLAPDGSSSLAQELVGCDDDESLSVAGVGLFYEIFTNSSTSNLYKFGAGVATGPTSFSVDVTDGEFTVPLPISIEVLP